MSRDRRFEHVEAPGPGGQASPNGSGHERRLDEDDRLTPEFVREVMECVEAGDDEGARRLVQKAEGYRYTVKSGQVTFQDGEHTGALPGGLVRGGREAVILPMAAE